MFLFKGFGVRPNSRNPRGHRYHPSEISRGLHGLLTKPQSQAWDWGFACRFPREAYPQTLFLNFGFHPFQGLIHLLEHGIGGHANLPQLGFKLLDRHFCHEVFR